MHKPKRSNPLRFFGGTLRILLIIILSYLLISCQYEPDFGLLNDAQANFFSYYVNINGNNCIDMDGNVGLCAKQLASNTPLTIRLSPRPYSYDLSMRCSSKIDTSLKITHNIEILKFVLVWKFE